MTDFICLDCWKRFNDKYIKWYKLPKVREVGSLYDDRDTQMCTKCYGKRIKYDLLKDLPEEERKKLTQELFEIMELLQHGN
jgi:hypothetical protein